jgi:outer membrane protein assembly complex protein YaeT
MVRLSARAIPAALALLIIAGPGGRAATLADLRPERSYVVDAINFSGNSRISTSDLQAVMQTTPRRFYELWKKRPPFDPSTFSDDLDRIKRLYRVKGYYGARVAYHLDLVGDRVAAHIAIVEGAPVKVARLTVATVGRAPPPAALEKGFKLPLAEGDVFSQGLYQLGEQQLLGLYQRHGYPFARVHRRAEVYTGPGRADVWYRVTPGPHGVFGQTTIEIAGTRPVESSLVRRELTYRAGEEFDSRKIAASRENILKLNLFSSVDFLPQESQPGRVDFPILVRARTRTSREFNVTFGYNTETLFNASLRWNHYNWLGGGRQLLLDGTYSSITSGLTAQLIQPYFLSRATRGVILGTLYQESYQTYQLNAARLVPSIEYLAPPHLTASFGWRLGYLQFNSLAASTIAALGGVRRQGILAGPTASVIENTTDDPMNPQHGAIFFFNADVADRSLGSDYRYWRTVGEARGYHLLGWQTVLAGRVKLGLADTFGPVRDIPLSERFYSGGEGSVRGYGLRRIGPLSAANDPLGGLSLVEGSIELRRPLFWKLAGAVFFDCGQVSTQAYHIPVDALQCGFGPAVSFATPVGPVRLDLGFPTKRPDDDSIWQVYFSIGQYF